MRITYCGLIFLCCTFWDFHQHVAAPVPNKEVYIFAPVEYFSCFRLYWYHAQNLAPGHWPSALPNIPGTLIFEWNKKLSPRGMFAGLVMWVLEYEYPEQLQYISCLQMDPTMGGYAEALALRSAYLVALNMLGLPCHSVHQHYRVAMLSPSQARW